MLRLRLMVIAATTAILLFSPLPLVALEEEEETYGVDVSFPTHNRVSTNYPFLPHNLDPDHHSIPPQFEHMPLQTQGDRQELYIQHLEGCRKAHEAVDPTKCDLFEWDRMIMNRRQPQSMVNLTETGFKKVRAPAHLKELVDEFWAANNDAEKEKTENWGVGNTYVNYWESPTTLISVDDKGLRGSGAKLKEELWAATSAIAEEWTQQELQPSSLYGIRIYHENAIMMPHVDRLPLVVSAMLNVAQDTEEDWPLEVYDHRGHAHNITLHPGEMLLFESHSVIHGHPFPLKGKFYASLFLHFEPTGRQYSQVSGRFFLRDDHRSQKENARRDANGRYHQASKDGLGGPSAGLDGKLPPYIKRKPD
jgi:prolyl 4-hydroxylase